MKTMITYKVNMCTSLTVIIFFLEIGNSVIIYIIILCKYIDKSHASYFYIKYLSYYIIFILFFFCNSISNKSVCAITLMRIYSTREQQNCAQHIRQSEKENYRMFSKVFSWKFARLGLQNKI